MKIQYKHFNSAKDLSEFVNLSTEWISVISISGGNVYNTYCFTLWYNDTKEKAIDFTSLDEKLFDTEEKAKSKDVKYTEENIEDLAIAMINDDDIKDAMGTEVAVENLVEQYTNSKSDFYRDWKSYYG